MVALRIGRTLEPPVDNVQGSAEAPLQRLNVARRLLPGRLIERPEPERRPPRVLGFRGDQFRLRAKRVGRFGQHLRRLQVVRVPRQLYRPPSEEDEVGVDQPLEFLLVLFRRRPANAPVGRGLDLVAVILVEPPVGHLAYLAVPILPVEVVVLAGLAVRPGPALDGPGAHERLAGGRVLRRLVRRVSEEGGPLVPLLLDRSHPEHLLVVPFVEHVDRVAQSVVRVRMDRVRSDFAKHVLREDVARLRLRLVVARWHGRLVLGPRRVPAPAEALDAAGPRPMGAGLDALGAVLVGYGLHGGVPNAFSVPAPAILAAQVLGGREGCDRRR
mmetsp:Transcript_5497/g.11972  ORF Transcript_5497/g.11972 Transcript_5497/m.11972 type:complete len:328 (+) Transcript_5497:339-1322(+)